jgi:hypothetical protein
MDDKRFYRKLKQEVKKTGNRKLRRFLKDVSADPGEFDYGSAESSALNGRDGRRKRHNDQEEEENFNEVDGLANFNESSKTDGSECPQAD